MTTTKPRKWTATVGVGGHDFTDMVEYTDDTLAATTAAAVALATRLIRDEVGSDGAVILHKQLAGDDEPVRDRSVYVYRDHDGAIRTQR